MGQSNRLIASSFLGVRYFFTFLPPLKPFLSVFKLAYQKFTRKKEGEQDEFVVFILFWKGYQNLSLKDGVKHEI